MLTDRELRDLLLSVEADVAPEPAFEANLFARLLTARSATAPARSRTWLATLGLRQRHALVWATVLLILASLAAVALSGAFRPRPIVQNATPAPSTSAQASEDLAAAAPLQMELTAQLPTRPETIYADPAGGIWMITGGQVRRLTLATGKTDPPIDLGGRAATAMAGRKDLLWVASRDGNTVFEVDPVSGETLRSVAVAAPAALAIDTSTVVEGLGGKSAGQTQGPIRGPLVVVAGADGTVSAFDSESMTLKWTQKIAGTPIVASEGGGRIWVGTRPADDSTALALAAFMAGSGQPVGTIHLHAGWATPRSIAVQQAGTGVGSVWVPDPGTGSIAVIDPAAKAVVRTISVGENVTEIAVRPGGDFVVTYADGAAKPGTTNALAVIHAKDGTVARYVVRLDSPGAGQGIVGLSFEDESDQPSQNIATFWKVWFAMDWESDPSVGRVNQHELP